MDNVVDTLQIEVESSSKGMTSSVDKLIASIRKLEKLGQGTGIKTLTDRLRKFSQLNFSKVNSQLTRIKNNLIEISKMQGLMKSLLQNPVQGTKLSKDNSISTPNSTDTSSSFTPNTTRTAEEALDRIKEKVEETQSEFRQLPQSAEQATTAIQTPLDKLNRTYELLQQRAAHLGQVYEETRKKFGEKNIKTLDAELAFRKADQSAAMYGSRIQDVLKQQEKIGKSRFQLDASMLSRFASTGFLFQAMAMLYSQLFRSLATGIQNIVKFSDEANESMSKLASSAQLVQNSTTAMLMPLINSATPILTDLMDLLAEVMNSFGAFFAIITGQDSYTKAIKNNVDYRESLDDMQKSMLGIDEINVLGKNENSGVMFEEVELNTGEVIKTLAEVAATLATISTLIYALTGKNVWGSLASGVSNFFNKLKNLSPVKKATTAVAALAVEAYTFYNAAYDAANGSATWQETLTAMLPTFALVEAAMYAMYGPIGLVIGALVAMVSAIAGVAQAQIDLAYETAMTDFFNNQGVEIAKVNELLQNYFDTLYIDKQAEWNEVLAEAVERLKEASYNYDILWDSISQCEQIDETKINQLSDAFNELADAANAVNEAAIGSLMASIRTGIELNITPELTEKLDGLLASLQTAQDIIGVQVSGINEEYQALLNEIAANGGKVTTEQRERLEELRQQLNDLTLTDQTSSYEWKISLEEALQQGINAGTNEDEIRSAIDELIGDRDKYLDTLKTNQASSLSTIAQLIEIDRTQFGGALGFYEEGKTLEENSNYQAILESYNAQVAEVMNKYNEVLDSIIESFASKALNYDNYHSGSGVGDFFASIGAGVSGLFDWIWTDDGGWDFLADRAASEEQKEFLDWLKSIRGYATGGFPDSGEYFFARENGVPELVGSIGNNTAVANNDQIVEAVSQGVYEAVVSAMSNENDNGTIIIQIVDRNGRVQSEQIISAAERKNRRDGKRVISVEA